MLLYNWWYIFWRNSNRNKIWYISVTDLPVIPVSTMECRVSAPVYVQLYQFLAILVGVIGNSFVIYASRQYSTFNLDRLECIYIIKEHFKHNYSIMNYLYFKIFILRLFINICLHRYGQKSFILTKSSKYLPIFFVLIH